MVGEFIAHDSKLQVWALESRACGRAQNGLYVARSGAQPQKVRFWAEAEVGRQLRPADSVENDPERTYIACGSGERIGLVP